MPEPQKSKVDRSTVSDKTLIVLIASFFILAGLCLGFWWQSAMFVRSLFPERSGPQRTFLSKQGGFYLSLYDNGAAEYWICFAGHAHLYPGYYKHKGNMIYVYDSGSTMPRDILIPNSQGYLCKDQYSDNDAQLIYDANYRGIYQIKQISHSPANQPSEPEN